MKTFNYKILKVMAFSVIMLFMSSTVFAQVQESQQDTTAQDTTTQMNDRQETMPQEQNQRADDDMKSQHPDQGVKYSETIEQSELPQDVNSSLDELYPAHEIQEAYRGEDNSFKVKVKNETDEAVVYYDSEGNFLRAENLSGLTQEGELPQEQSQQTMESQDKEQWGTDTQQDTQQSDQQDAQEGTQQEEWGTEDDNQDAEMQDDDRASPQEQNQTTYEAKDTDKGVDYSESVQKEELPQEVTSSLDELYPAHEIQEVHQGNDDSYRVKVKNEDDVAVVYYDSQGDFLRAQNLSGLNQEGELPQEQSQRIQDTDANSKNQQGTMHNQQGMEQGTMHNQHGTMHNQQGMKQGTMHNQQGSQDNQWETEGIQEADTSSYQASPQEQNQRIEDTEESQDADRWGTENRMPDYESDTTSTGTQNEDWGTKEDTLSYEDSAYPQEQDQKTEEMKDKEDDWRTDDMGTDQSTWQGGEGTDTTSTPARVDTTAVYNNQWEEENIEQGDDTTLPQEQSQQTSGTNPGDTTSTYNNQMMEDNTLERDDTASPQEQYQATGDENVNYSEEIQENELPESVTTSLEELYPDYKIEEVYRGDDDSYKVKVKKNDEKVAVYYNSDGLFYRDEVLDDMLEKTNKDTNQDW